MTTRRSFMASILAAGFAPAAIGSGVLMPVRRIVAPLVKPGWVGYDWGIEDPTVSIEAYLRGDYEVRARGLTELRRIQQRELNFRYRNLMDNMVLTNTPGFLPTGDYLGFVHPNWGDVNKV
jgi:hypothetical protein